MEKVKGLGYENLVDYILDNSRLEIKKFELAMRGSTVYSPSFVAKKEFVANMRDSHDCISFVAVKNNQLVLLGTFSYKTFILAESSIDYDVCMTAITSFLDLCIKKWNDVSIVVPSLVDDFIMWDNYYKYDPISVGSDFFIKINSID